MEEIFGYISAAFIGLSLGLFGGGGSILTIPVLIYLFHLNPGISTSYSLFVVGTTSLVGSVTYYKNGFVQLKTALLFGISSIVTILLVRQFVLPRIPAHFFISDIRFSKAAVFMVVFALLMAMASFSMIFPSIDKKQKNASLFKLIVVGLGVGLITGFLGAGGGFILIPALVLLLNLPMKTAVGTSLFIITINSLIGFLGDLNLYKIDWRFLLIFSSIAIVGIFLGTALSKKIPAQNLKKGFGIFILLMSVFIVLKEFSVF